MHVFIWKFGSKLWMRCDALNLLKKLPVGTVSKTIAKWHVSKNPDWEKLQSLKSIKRNFCVIFLSRLSLIWVKLEV